MQSYRRRGTGNKGDKKEEGEGESVVRGLGKTGHKFIRGRRKTSYRGKREHESKGLRED